MARGERAGKLNGFYTGEVSPVSSVVGVDLDRFAAEGFAMISACLDADAVAECVRELTAIDERLESSAVRRNGEVYALRNLAKVLPTVRRVLGMPRVRPVLRAILGPRITLVRSILFDKTATANWHVTWHQDLTVAVRERHDRPGWGPWSIKAGVNHVQPPREILERMMTLRIHLDRCGAGDGPLLVIPGSHLCGRLSKAQIDNAVTNDSSVPCAVAPGDAVILRPLLVHSSGAATAPSHRRVMHFELSGDTLPAPLAWPENTFDA